MEPSASASAVRKALRAVLIGLGNLLRFGQNKPFDWYLTVQHLYRYLRFPHYRRSANSLEELGLGEYAYEEDQVELRSSKIKLKALIPQYQLMRRNYPDVYGWQTLDYEPESERYPGKITFFWTREEPERSKGWRKTIKAKQGEVETHIIPGNHITSKTEHLPTLTEYLSECLKKAQNL